MSAAVEAPDPSQVSASPEPVVITTETGGPDASFDLLAQSRSQPPLTERQFSPRTAAAKARTKTRTRTRTKPASPSDSQSQGHKAPPRKMSSNPLVTSSSDCFEDGSGSDSGSDELRISRKGTMVILSDPENDDDITPPPSEMDLAIDASHFSPKITIEPMSITGSLPGPLPRAASTPSKDLSPATLTRTTSPVVISLKSAAASSSSAPSTPIVPMLSSFGSIKRVTVQRDELKAAKGALVKTPAEKGEFPFPSSTSSPPMFACSSSPILSATSSPPIAASAAHSVRSDASKLTLDLDMIEDLNEELKEYYVDDTVLADGRRDSKPLESMPGVLAEAVLLQESDPCKPLISLPRQYANVNESRDIDINNLEISVEPTDHWKVYERIGKGKYSEVFEGQHAISGEVACVKILKPCKPHLLKQEIFVLSELRHGPNIIQLLHTLQDVRSELFCLVFEILTAVEFKQLYSKIDDKDMRYYLFEMLRGFDFAHSKGIIHRDVKPQNILVDTSKKQVRLIDWGLAAFYFPGHEYTVRVATRAYKAPELLVGYGTYHYAIDMWAFGCMFAGIIFQKNYFFHGGPQQGDQLHKIVEVLGTDDFDAFTEKLRIPQPEFVEEWPSYPRKDWSDFLSDSSEKNKFVTKNALDLLDGLLVYDPGKRLTAAEAMEHPYFEKVRRRHAMRSARSSAELLPPTAVSPTAKSHPKRVRFDPVVDLSAETPTPEPPMVHRMLSGPMLRAPDEDDF